MPVGKHAGKPGDLECSYLHKSPLSEENQGNQTMSLKQKLLVTSANGRTGLPAAKELLKLGFKELENNTFAIGGVTNVVNDIVDRDAEDFESIARRYIAESKETKRTLSNKMRAIWNLVRILFTVIPDVKKYEREMNYPQFMNGMNLTKDNNIWLASHK